MSSVTAITPKYYVRFKTAECIFLYHHPTLQLSHCADFIPIGDANKNIISKAKDEKGNFYAVKWVEPGQSLFIKAQLLAYQGFLTNNQPSFLIEASWFANLVTLQYKQNNLAYDAVLLPWIAGNTLGIALLNSIKAENEKRIYTYYTALGNLLGKMKAQGSLSHGDFHSNNIMLRGNDLVLIDYDTLQTGIPGAPGHNYNDNITLYHPQKINYPYHIYADEFPALCLLITLYAGSKNLELVSAFLQQNGTIFKEEDLVSLDASPVYLSLKKIKDKQLNTLLQLMQLSLLKTNLQVPELLFFISEDESHTAKQSKLSALLKEAKRENKQAKNGIEPAPALFIQDEAKEKKAIAKEDTIKEKPREAITLPVAVQPKPVKDFKPRIDEMPKYTLPPDARKRKKPIAIIGALAVAMALGAGIYYFTVKKDETPVTILPIAPILDTPKISVHQNDKLVVPAPKEAVTTVAPDLPAKKTEAKDSAIAINKPEVKAAPIAPPIKKIETPVVIKQPAIINNTPTVSTATSSTIKIPKPFIKNNSKPKKAADKKAVIFKKLDL